VFVSKQGVSRAVALACVALMEIKSISLFEAVVVIRSRRYLCSLHPYFAAQLAVYEAQRRVLVRRPIAGRPRRDSDARPRHDSDARIGS